MILTGRVAADTPSPQPADAAAVADQDLPRIRTHFDSALQHPFKLEGGHGTAKEPYRYRVRFPDGRQESGYFLFLVENAAGKTLRFEFHSARADNWKTLNPVIHETDDLGGSSPGRYLAQPDLYKALPPNGNKTITGVSKVPFADTRGLQEWHYLPLAASVEGGVFSFQVTPDKACAFIAMRPPYTPQLQDMLIARLQVDRDREVSNGKEPDYQVHALGRSERGRRLWLVQIGADPADRPGRKPVILFYAREHGDEHDTSWVAQGVIDFLLGPHRHARAIRRKAIVLVIPVLDPDTAADNQYEGIIRTFSKEVGSKESEAYAAWFRAWVDAGHRLDVVYNLHNVESAEGPHLFAPEFEGSEPRLAAAKQLDESLRDAAEQAGYATRGTSATGRGLHRLGGYLAAFYGPLHQPYQVNSQAAEGHLSLYELKDLGYFITAAAVGYLYSAEAQPLLQDVHQVRHRRDQLFERYGWMKIVQKGGPMRQEILINKLPPLEANVRKTGFPIWEMREFFEREGVDWDKLIEQQLERQEALAAELEKKRQLQQENQK